MILKVCLTVGIMLAPSRAQETPPHCKCVECTYWAVLGNCTCPEISFTYTVSCSPSTCQTPDPLPCCTACGQYGVPGCVAPGCEDRFFCTLSSGYIFFPTGGGTQCSPATDLCFAYSN